MEKRTLKTYTDRAEKILSDREKELKTLQKKLADLEELITLKTEELEQATNVTDLKRYQAVKKELSDARDEQEMNSKRFDNLTKKELISKAEYEESVSAIKTLVSDAEKETRQKLVKLSEEMYSEGKKLSEIINKANAILHTYQHDLYRDGDMLRTAKGDVIPFSNAQKIGDEPWNAVYWGMSAARSFQYEKTTGKKIEPESKPPVWIR